jgi:hypothetical protein
LKNYKSAEESNKQASAYYLEALANMKQKKGEDPEALRTMEMLAETHRRKAKILQMRIQFEGKSSVDQVKAKIKALKQEKAAENRSNKINKPGELSEK